MKPTKFCISLNYKKKIDDKFLKWEETMEVKKEKWKWNRSHWHGKIAWCIYTSNQDIRDTTGDRKCSVIFLSFYLKITFEKVIQAILWVEKRVVPKKLATIGDQI